MGTARMTSYLDSGSQWMLFVDGENLAIQGVNALRANGVEPVPGPDWDRDTFLWLPGFPARRAFFGRWFGSNVVGPAVRAYYYTSKTGDEPAITRTRLALRELGFEPRVFRRPQGGAKGVDLALATDLLTLGGEGHYNVAVLFAGDGDYVPLIEAVKRLGHYAVVGFFPDHGLNTELRIAADDFVDLTQHFVNAWKADARKRAEAEAKKPAKDSEPAQ